MQMNVVSSYVGNIFCCWIIVYNCLLQWKFQVKCWQVKKKENISAHTQKFTVYLIRLRPGTLHINQKQVGF